MTQTATAVSPSPSPAPSPFQMKEPVFTLLVGSIIIAAIGGWILVHYLRGKANGS